MISTSEILPKEKTITTITIVKSLQLELLQLHSDIICLLYLSNDVHCNGLIQFEGSFATQTTLTVKEIEKLWNIDNPERGCVQSS